MAVIDVTFGTFPSIWRIIDAEIHCSDVHTDEGRPYQIENIV
jgi:hypothetical protein